MGIIISMERVMKHIALIVVLGVFAAGLAAEIQSTSAGGYWNNPSTWAGGSIPGQFDDVVLNGLVYPDTMSYCHNLSLSGTGRLTHGFDSQLHGALRVYGDLNNGGLVEKWDNAGAIVLYCYGNIINSGTLKPNHLYLSGAADQYLSNQGTFLPPYLTDLNESSALVLSSDLATNGAITINLDGAHLVLNGTFVSDLSMTGGILQNAVIEGGNGATYTGAGDAWLSGVTGNELVLNGTVRFNHGSSFGILVNHGTISTPVYCTGNLTVTQSLTNFGVITRDGGGTLNLALGGDFYEHGSTYANRIDFIAPGPHNIWRAGTANPINGANISSSPTAGIIQLLSDWRFYHCAFDLGGGAVLMYNSDGGYDLNFTGGCLKTGTLNGDSSSSLTMSETAFIQSITADRLSTFGTVTVYETNAIAQLSNHGTLTTPTYSNGNLTITQRLDNFGYLTMGGDGNLTIYLGGDLYNYGTMNHSATFVNGASDQYIRNAGTINWSGRFWLVSELGPSQWYFNGNPYYTGYVTNYNVNPGNLGVWQPFIGTIYGRQIIIGDGSTLSAPQNLTLMDDSGILRLSWNQVPDAFFYTVYASSSPDGSFTVLHQYVSDADLSDGWVSREIAPVEQLRFFRVTAQN